MINRLVFALLLVCSSVVLSFAQMHYLSTLSVRDICHYGNTLYQATGGGLVVTNDDMGKEKRYDHSNGLPTNNISWVEVDSTGMVWVTAYDGRILGLRLSASAATVVVDTTFNGSVTHYFNGMVALKGTLWVLIDGQMHSYSNGRWSTHAAFTSGILQSNLIKKDEDGNLWTVNNSSALGGGAWCYNTRSDSWTKASFPEYFKGLYLNSFAVVSPDFFLISFWDSDSIMGGTFLAVRENKNDTAWTWESVNDNAWGLFNDSYDNSFVFFDEELHVCQLNNINALNLIPTGIANVSVSSIETYGLEKKMWIGDPTYGLSFFKGMAMVAKNSSVASTADFPYGINSIKSVTIDNLGQAWIMEQMERFISIFNPKSNTWKTQSMDLDGVTSATVKAIGRGQNGDMWFVTPKETVKKKSDGSRSTYLDCGGDYIYDKMKDWIWVVGDSNKVKSYSYQDPLGFQPVIRCNVYPNLKLTKIAPISPTEFYVASSGSNQAIYHYKNGVWTMTIIATTGTCDMDVINGELVVGTDYGIHASTSGGKTLEFTDNKGRGLNYTELYSLEVAPNGNIMISTDNGLFVSNGDNWSLPPYNLNIWSRPPHSPIITPIVNSIVFDTTNDLIWYSGTEGITTFSWSGSTTTFNQPKSFKLSAPSISLNRQGIRYSLPGTGDVCLSIFSVSGRQLASKTISGNLRTGLIGLPNAAAGSLVYRIKSGENMVTGSLTRTK